MNHFSREFYKTFLDTIHKYHSEKIMYKKMGIRNYKAGDLGSSMYIHNDIIKTIKQTMKYTIQLELHSKINIDIYIYGKQKNELIEYSTQILIILESYIQYITRLYTSLPLPKNMKLYVYLTDAKKQIDGKEHPLTQLHVNTGYTSFNQEEDYNEIVIYRKEEVLKVLIHEITHYFMIDRVTLPASDMKQLQTIFRVTNDLHIQESITDFWACYVNMMYFAILDTGVNSYRDFKNRLLQNLKDEIQFIQTQAQKVAYIQDHCWDRSNYIAENTHVIAYYIIKAVMYRNFNRYINDYKDWKNKKHFQLNIVKHVKKELPTICNTGLRMSSLDVNEKMKTI